jgi:hypothetical protein
VDTTVEEERAEEEHGPDDTGVEEERGTGVVEEERGTGVVEEERCAGVEEERGGSMEVHAEDVEEGTRWRADVEEGARYGEMTGLGFGDSGALKKKNSSDGH